MQTRRTDQPDDFSSSSPELAEARHVEIEAITRRMPTERLERGGIKSIRILNETRFREVLEGIIEERVRRRLASSVPEPEARALREEYRARWDQFRSRYEEKLRLLEEALTACSAGGSAPPPRR